MGLRIFGSGCRSDTPTSAVVSSVPPADPSRALPNPNKFRWVLTSFDFAPNGWCVAVIRYHDCTNYEGRKVLVYDSTARFHELMKTGAVDPHFDDKSYSPVARFEPTERGIQLALQMMMRGA